MLTPLPTREEIRVLCLEDGNLSLHHLPGLPGSEDYEVFVVNEIKTLVLVLQATSFQLLDLKVNTSFEGQVTYGSNLRSGEVAQVLKAVRDPRRSRARDLALRKSLPLGGVEYLQLLDNLLIHLCVFKASSPRVTLQRCSVRAPRPSTFPLCTKVLPATSEVVGNSPLVAVVEVELQATSMAVAQSGAVHFSLHTLELEHSHSQFTAQAGPLEAVLTPSFGDVLDVLVGAVTMPRSPAPMKVRIPPLFVASAGGLHCVLSHQVLSLPLPGLCAIASGPGKTSWHGVSCLVFANGFYVVHLLQKDELSNDDSLPEEQMSYQLVSTPIQLAGPVVALNNDMLLLKRVETGPDQYLCCSSRRAVLMELRQGQLHIRTQLEAELEQEHGVTGGVVQACCCTAWPGLDWQQLCVALPGLDWQQLCVALPGTSSSSVEGNEPRNEMSELQLWQMASAEKASSWKITIDDGDAFESHGWPQDTEILLHQGDFLALTSRSDDVTVLFSLRGSKTEEFQRLDGYSLLLRRFQQRLLQVTQKELRMFAEAGDLGFKMSQMEAIQPFCSHAAAGESAAICFFAAGAVLWRKEVRTVASQHAVALAEQISSLSLYEALGGSSQVFVALWLSHDVLLLDGSTLNELQRFSAQARIHSMHAFPSETSKGWILAAGTVDGHLLLWKEHTGVPSSQAPCRWRLCRGPLQLQSCGMVGVVLRGQMAQAFLLRSSTLEPETLLLGEEAVSLCQRAVTLLIDGGTLRLNYGKLEDAQGRHCVLQRRQLRGEVLALAFKARFAAETAKTPCILVLAQHRWMRRLALMAVDWKLQPLFTVPMEEVPPWPSGRSSAWLWDLPGQGVLVALGHPGLTVVGSRVALELELQQAKSLQRCDWRARCWWPRRPWRTHQWCWAVKNFASFPTPP